MLFVVTAVRISDLMRFEVLIVVGCNTVAWQKLVVLWRNILTPYSGLKNRPSK
jgi:hypothetical protein